MIGPLALSGKIRPCRNTQINSYELIINTEIASKTPKPSTKQLIINFVAIWDKRFGTRLNRNWEYTSRVVGSCLLPPWLVDIEATYPLWNRQRPPLSALSKHNPHWLCSTYGGPISLFGPVGQGRSEPHVGDPGWTEKNTNGKLLGRYSVPPLQWQHQCLYPGLLGRIWPQPIDWHAAINPVMGIVTRFCPLVWEKTH